MDEISGDIPNGIEILLRGVSNTGRLNLSTRNLSNVNLSGINLGKADLSKADLSKADLSKANLRGTDLTGAILCGADLRGADLREAHLRNVDMKGALLQGLDLSGLDLSGADLRGVDFSEVNLRGADLSGANLSDAVLNGSTLKDGNLSRADLSRADLSHADLRGTRLRGADLSEAILRGADLSNADLSRANLSQTKLIDANMAGCLIYAISAWDVQLENTNQLGLVIAGADRPIITVDNLEVAQFINLLLDNQKIRDVINAITSKVVLILGRFIEERKAILDALREELRNYNYSPVVFDFDKPDNRNLTETVSTIAHMSRFIIADLTSARSVPQELERIVPRLHVPVKPLLHTSEEEPYSMFADFKHYPWVLPTYRYTDQETLIHSLYDKIILPAESKAREYEDGKKGG
jgi:uncharacterized protein YjbI with pentapeptide repeats